jgi:hypothetical protein
MVDDSENEMNANNSESEIKYQEISAPADISATATAGFEHQIRVCDQQICAGLPKTAATTKKDR